ncbi:hypothetical protein, partial [Paenibacillus riograndensis]|uniref:hypothetical protein n=1 Tax=Paenibacillus riograndensis TaxID=483937 RepID=UPI001B7FD5D8
MEKVKLIRRNSGGTRNPGSEPVIRPTEPEPDPRPTKPYSTALSAIDILQISLKTESVVVYTADLKKKVLLTLNPRNLLYERVNFI